MAAVKAVGGAEGVVDLKVGAGGLGDVIEGCEVGTAGEHGGVLVDAELVAQVEVTEADEGIDRPAVDAEDVAGDGEIEAVEFGRAADQEFAGEEAWAAKGRAASLAPPLVASMIGVARSGLPLALEATL